VALEEDLVACAPVVLAAKEVVEAHLVERGAGGVGREVAADPWRLLVRAQHHERRVPADDAPDPLLHLLVAWERRLLLGRDGVDVARLHEPRQPDPELARALQDLAQQEVGALAAGGAVDVVGRRDPFRRLSRVWIRELALERLQHVPVELVVIGIVHGGLVGA